MLLSSIDDRAISGGRGKHFNRTNKTLKLFYSWGEIVPITAIDSPGLHQFVRQSLLLLADWKDFAKTTIAIDTLKQVILSFKISLKPVHDVKHAEPLLRKCRRMRKTRYYVVDKEYDSKELHRQIREEIGAYLVIPVRKWKGKVYPGKYGPEMYA